MRLARSCTYAVSVLSVVTAYPSVICRFICRVFVCFEYEEHQRLCLRVSIKDRSVYWTVASRDIFKLRAAIT